MSFCPVGYYCNSLFFSSSKFSSNCLHKLIFTRSKLNKDNFTSRVWWALIEVIVPCAEEMAGEKEMSSCVRGYHIYEDMWAAACNWGIVGVSLLEKFLL